MKRSGTGVGSAEKKWKWLRHTLRKRDDSIAKQALQRKRARRQLKNEMWTAGFQVQLEEDGGGSAGQSWTETSCLSPVLHRE